MKVVFRLSIVLVPLIFLLVTIDFLTSRQVYYGDALGYYAYLPATFIHDNLDHIQDVINVETIPQEVKANMSYWPQSYAVNDSGNVIIQYTYGVALTNLPFFGLGHLASYLTGMPMDGYGKWYAIGLRLSALFYASMGLLLLWRMFKKWGFEEEMGLLSINIMFWGTNLFWFTFFQPGMAHINLFFLVTLLIFLSDKFWDKPSNSMIAAIGLVLGVIILIRPTDFIFVLIPILYGVNNGKEWKNRWAFFKQNGLKVLGIGALMALIPVLPQLLYWKMLTGTYFFDSYKDQTFNWTRPQIYPGLFGANNGWLTYTPVALVLICALYISRFKYNVKWASMVLLPIYIYIAYSWWCFSYINGLGSRPMIHLYGLLAIGFSAMLTHICHQLRYTVIVFSLILGFVNLNYTYKQLDDILLSEESTHAYNFGTFFKSGIEVSDLILRDTRFRQPVLSTKEKMASSRSNQDTIINFFEEESILFKYTMEPHHLENDFIYVEGCFNLPWVVYSTYEHHMLFVKVKKGKKNKFWRGIKLNNKVGKKKGEPTHIHDYRDNVWSEVGFAIPSNKFDVGDTLQIELWNPSKKHLMFTDVSLYSGSE
ncbi:MAG: hypothetical protein KDC49_17225 [Saprospiraceae bacterium]|nr:hypothetical protein [Saprospiraceae bacterium]